MNSEHTATQMQQAPIGAIYIWPTGSLLYPQQLAKKHQRTDLQIVSTSWLRDRKWLGIHLSGIVVDHACRLTDREASSLQSAISRIRLDLLTTKENN